MRALFFAVVVGLVCSASTLSAEEQTPTGGLTQCMLQREIIDGQSKHCVYSCWCGNKIISRPVYQTCPMTFAIEC